MTTESVKLCRDCKHIERSFFGLMPRASSPRCGHPSSLSLVHGRPGEFCDLSRRYGPCGREARLFEPRKP